MWMWMLDKKRVIYAKIGGEARKTAERRSSPETGRFLGPIIHAGKLPRDLYRKWRFPFSAVAVLS